MDGLKYVMRVLPIMPLRLVKIATTNRMNIYLEIPFYIIHSTFAVLKNRKKH